MTGYIRPCKGQMKCKDWDCFEGVYCGLCRVIGRKYGQLCRGFLSYDFVLYALLLAEEAPALQARRCLAHPGRRRPLAQAMPPLERAADAAVLFARHKLLDTVRDGRLFRRLSARLLLLLTRKAGRRAEDALPNTAQALRKQLALLRDMERERLPSLDRPADTFAKALEALNEASPPGRTHSVARVLYHAGRWVYLLDAADDLAEDFEAGRYNPVIARYALETPVLPPELQDRLRTTLAHSRTAAANAFEEIDGHPCPDIVMNILVEGTYGSESRVFREKKPVK